MWLMLFVIESQCCIHVISCHIGIERYLCSDGLVYAGLQYTNITTVLYRCEMYNLGDSFRRPLIVTLSSNLDNHSNFQ